MSNMTTYLSLFFCLALLFFPFLFLLPFIMAMAMAIAIDYDGRKTFLGVAAHFFFRALSFAGHGVFLFFLFFIYFAGLYCTFCLGGDEGESKIGGWGGVGWEGKLGGRAWLYDLEWWGG
jgi:hypothetical protein